MRLRLLTALAATAIAVVAVGVTPASASPTPPVPVKNGWTVTGPIPQHYPPLPHPAGDPCPFPVRETFPINHVVGYTYTNAAGRDVATYYTGKLIERAVRTDTGKVVHANLSGDGFQTYGKDGSSILYGFGPFGSTQHPTDHPASELAVLHGISALKIAADGTKTILYSTRVTDLCKKLA